MTAHDYITAALQDLRAAQRELAYLPFTSEALTVAVRMCEGLVEDASKLLECPEDSHASV